MNRFFIFSLVAVLFTAASCSQKKEIVVEHPPYVMRNSSSAEIDKIVLNDTATVLYITNYSYPNSRFRYSAETYIRANNLKYTVIKADGIELDKWLSEPTGKTSFTLTFPPIPRETRKIDFIESDCDNCFKTWGIELKSKTLTDRLPVPAKIAKFKVDPTDRTPLQTPVFKDTAAIIKGRILGYRPELFRNINVYINNPFTGNQDECETTVENDGTFSVSVPVFCTMGVLFRAWNLINSYVYVSPGEETEIYLDLQQLYQQSCRDRIDK
jgi:hypothetical protein